MDIIINDIVNNLVNYVQLYGIWLGFLIIILESILPFLPLFVFIALNVEAFGFIIGFLLSWSATIVGCLISYFFFKYLVGNRIDKYINKSKKKKEKLRKVVNAIKNVKFSTLVVLMALPFSPAFMFNIACGITKVNFRKFFLSLLISKLSIIYFWGFIGTSLFDSIMDVTILIRVVIMLLVAFMISKFVMKKYNIE
ncbi:MAG: TVP38/TMEM64 family protein [Firmicutes bacterium]|nr:TVP38/TMEM64 family protein [Bacillota bacterium]